MGSNAHIYLRIVCEGPTDYIILKGVIDKITGENNYYVQLQPEADLTGQYGNGWKGVWKWCRDCAKIQKQLMKNIEPTLDLLIIQMDGDVSRKEKSSHCRCESTICEYKGKRNPLECDVRADTRRMCPVVLPCGDHAASIEGYLDHLNGLIKSWLEITDEICIVIPCDSTEAWIVAAYDHRADVERLEDPWSNIIAKKKSYHNIRIPGGQKRLNLYKEFVEMVCANWEQVTKLCLSAKKFEEDIILFTASVPESQ